MSGEFSAAMSGGFYTFEHDVTRIMVGDLESVRARLAVAMEEMGYRVLNESPLQAKRNARKGGATGCSFNVLDYQTSLAIGLKSAGNNSTRVTFDYEVKNIWGYMSRGDRRTLTHEADAIIALAAAHSLAAHCPACGAEAAGSSRFCRQCGAPLSAPPPAELEALRLMAGANASYKSIAAGAFFLAIGLLLPLILFFIDQDPVKFAKTVKIISVLAGSFGLSGLIMLLLGLWHLSRTIKEKPGQDNLAVAPRRSPGVPDTAELPPQSIQHPVTEATTDLLSQEVVSAEQLPSKIEQLVDHRRQVG